MSTVHSKIKAIHHFTLAVASLLILSLFQLKHILRFIMQYRFGAKAKKLSFVLADWPHNHRLIHQLQNVFH